MLWQPATAPAETIDGAVPFIVKKHKGLASCEEAGGGRPEGWGAAWPGGLLPILSPPGWHRLPCCLPQPCQTPGPGSDGGSVPRQPLRLDEGCRVAGGIKAGFDFSSSHCFNWVIINRLL